MYESEGPRPFLTFLSAAAPSLLTPACSEQNKVLKACGAGKHIKGHDAA